MGGGKRRWWEGCRIGHALGNKVRIRVVGVGVGNTSGGTVVTCDVVAGGAGVC